MRWVVFLAIAGLVAAALWWWFIGRNSPRYPPIDLDADDPELVAAVARAKSTVPGLRRLFGAGETDAQVKVLFVTSQGVDEFLWAELLELRESDIAVRLLTPPVSHVGRVERLRTHVFDDIVDWVVFAKDGRIFGGYTQRVAIQRGRERFGTLPRELEEQASKFADL